MTPNNHDEVSIAGTLTYSDYKRHNAYHRKKFVLGYFVLGILVFMYVYSNVVSGSWILVYPVVAFFSIISSGLITTIMVLLMNMRVRREYKSDQIIKNEISYVFSDDGINQKVRRSNAHIEWGDISVAKEDKDMFRLYVSKNKAIILLKRFFDSNDQKNVFKTLIKKNLESKKIKLRSG